MIKDIFKQAVADIVLGDEIGRIIAGSKSRRERKAAEDYRDMVLKYTHGDKGKVREIPLVPLMRECQGDLLWQDILLRMIEIEHRELMAAQSVDALRIRHDSQDGDV